MKILAFDTLMNACSVACFDSVSDSLFTKTIKIERGHAEILVPMIEDVMAQSKWTYQDIDLIGVTRGPGAFTGLRIGLSTARAYGLSLDKPVMGVSTFDAMYQNYAQKNKIELQVCILLETKRDDYYMALYSKESEVVMMGVYTGESILNMIAENESLVVIGNAVERFRSEYKKDLSGAYQISDSNQMIDISDFVRYFMSEYEMGQELNTALPLYLRDADVSFPKKKSRKLKAL
ncbi:MAG: tRNA (adenosine(37)-N6)-threonylcarbamoyltransferase complex dimerization subunit type 1 TsaB [Alphaproteobacteria bacterium]|nr:tRNA (adenosine(37)-N6)-threonylcarbamoyltransferase complex dimerization subunit type 1 TsaB [Alphaproteobacteria bacterium]